MFSFEFLPMNDGNLRINTKVAAPCNINTTKLPGFFWCDSYTPLLTSAPSLEESSNLFLIQVPSGKLVTLSWGTIHKNTALFGQMTIGIYRHKSPVENVAVSSRSYSSFADLGLWLSTTHAAQRWKENQGIITLPDQANHRHEPHWACVGYLRPIHVKESQ